jgi:hypothetical protein
LQIKRVEVGLAVVVIVIAVTPLITHVATRADFFELVAALLGLTAVLAVLSDLFLQLLFCLADVTAALVITVGTGGRRYPGQ